MLVPPDNFGLVEPGIYRCSKLEPEHFPFLETLQLKSLVVLDAEKPPRLLKNFIEANNIEIYNLGGLKISNHNHTGANSSSNKDDNEDDDNTETSSTSSKTETGEYNLGKTEIETIKLTSKSKNDQWMLIERNIISGAFELLLNKSKHNILLIDSTSTLVGILRKIQKWNFNSIINEYRIYSGNTNKSNYYAENFLELIQTELIPFEIDRLNSLLKQQEHQEEQLQQEQRAPTPPYQYIPNKTRGMFRSPDFQIPGSRKNSMDSSQFDHQFDDENDNESIDDEDIDDELLSASPQIPANLLKLAEMRKQDNPRKESIDSTGSDDDKFTPGTSPKYVRSNRKNSFNNDMILSASRGSFERRYSLADNKFVRPGSFSNANHKFRNQSISSSIPSSRCSFEGSLSLIKRLREKEDMEKSKDLKYSKSIDITPEEAQSLRENYDYKFYKKLDKYPISFEDVSIIKLKLPPDNKLPGWFIKNRNCWEENFKVLNRV
ncbi:uncharacterized protein AC631_00445 [Debaryomyces fabryi]|uniref:Protein OCA4 n=1 Tax=Debaryomyces fabryi TaxID=58627 RepID=A0A0V1Q5R0_9ASCO|nr:uncharacterized protein AC631_00445 [Debaryomyces fabryi]KSA03810.1 hypothetical protein AC631_00445 [Debaryomyces fabryi]CUM45330.1 unnamed protein product [Debaryomyces fabryi]